jgi:hypothetical protein
MVTAPIIQIWFLPTILILIAAHILINCITLISSTLIDYCLLCSLKLSVSFKLCPCRLMLSSKFVNKNETYCKPYDYADTILA